MDNSSGILVEGNVNVNLMNCGMPLVISSINPDGFGAGRFGKGEFSLALLLFLFASLSGRS